MQRLHPRVTCQVQLVNNIRTIESDLVLARPVAQIPGMECWQGEARQEGSWATLTAKDAKDECCIGDYNALLKCAFYLSEYLKCVPAELNIVS